MPLVAMTAGFSLFAAISASAAAVSLCFLFAT
jgi:hypothetical protein